MKARSHVTILRDVERTNDRVRRLTLQLDGVLTHRRNVYVEARDRDDPVPFAKLAAAAGTTEAAVMQVVKKGRNANGTIAP